MNQQESILRTLFVVLSVLTSFAFIFYGVNVISAQSAPRWITTFAYVTAGYGLGNIAILSLAWNSREPWALTVSKLFALCYLGVFIMDMTKTGIQSGLEILGAIGLAAVLWCNGVAVKKVIERPE